MNAQSDHYWSQNFNTESVLVAGAVVGGSAGTSSVYYNPAIINEKGSSIISFSTNLLSMQDTRIDNLAGSNTEYDRFNFLIQPKFISYTGIAKRNKNINYELALFSRVTKDIRINYIFDSEVDIIQRLDGLETYIGQINYRDKYQDLYLGGGVSRRIGKRFSVGVSGFLSLKLVEFNTEIGAEAMQGSDTVYANGIPEPYYSAQTNILSRTKYWDLSVIIMLGAHYESLNKRLGIGLKFTMPNIHIYGEGKIRKGYSRARVYNDIANTFVEDLDFIGYEDRIWSNVKDPFSIAMGVRYWTKEKKNAVMFSMEYFFPISTYSFLESKDLKTFGNTENIVNSEDIDFLSSSNSVLNIAIGYVQNLSEKLTVAGGFKTDFNNLSSVSESAKEKYLFDIETRDLYMDKYHLVFGPFFKIKSLGIVLGVQYTWGRQKELSNIINFTNPIEYNPNTELSLQGIREDNMTLSYNEVSLFFGVTYGFGTKD